MSPQDVYSHGSEPQLELGRFCFGFTSPSSLHRCRSPSFVMTIHIKPPPSKSYMSKHYGFPGAAPPPKANGPPGNFGAKASTSAAASSSSAAAAAAAPSRPAQETSSDDLFKEESVLNPKDFWSERRGRQRCTEWELGVEEDSSQPRLRSGPIPTASRFGSDSDPRCCRGSDG